MLGLFGSSTKRKVLKLERIMMKMEAAAQAGDLRYLHFATGEQLSVLRWLHIEGDWSEEQVMKFIDERGLVRFPHDPAVQKLLSESVSLAESRFGPLS